MSKKEQIFSAIQTAITEGIQKLLTVCKQDWPDEEMYSFLLVADSEGYSVQAVAATEEGLSRIAREYGRSTEKQDNASFQAERIKFRWCGCEDGWYENYDPIFFSEANRLITEAHDAGFIELGDQQLQKVCLEVLKALDSLQVFGTGEAREKIMIGLSDIGGDHAEADFLGWAEAVNPPTVIERLRDDLKKATELFTLDNLGQ